MNKKYIERPQKFDQKEYKKNHYAHLSCYIKPELKQEIDNYCADKGISKSEFLRQAIEIMKNNKDVFITKRTEQDDSHIQSDNV